MRKIEEENAKEQESFPDPVEWATILANIAERSQNIVSAFLQRQSENPGLNVGMDPYAMGNTFFEMTTNMMRDPQRLFQMQMDLWQDYMRLWQSSTKKFMGQEAEPVASPNKADRRFRDPAWEENQLFDFLKQSYLLTARYTQGMVENIEGIEPKTAQKIDFYTRQFVDALSPSNFFMTNPEVLRATLDSRGQNLLKGLQNLIDDIEKGQGRLAISMTDETAFEVGGNIAITSGKVVYQNELMQLIQYKPLSDKVYSVPVLITPPWINKYYILDMRPDNSYVRWCLEQGFTVFMISWVNPDEELARKSYEDYLNDGFLKAIEKVQEITAVKDINLVSYCLGGTLATSGLAYLASKPKNKPGPDIKNIKSATFLTTLTDFKDVGELGVFIDEVQLDALDKVMQEKGYLSGSTMSTAFNLLRANDLIWSFVVSNYLLGKEPFPFDLLYWNSDSTRMPAAMHSFYLRKMYQENKLSEPGGLTLNGVPIDLRSIDLPIFILSTEEDHIAPWKSTYELTQMVKGDTTFCLASSGHIAGVVNPPKAGKYAHWVNAKTPKSPQEWLQEAEHHMGSWWEKWARWLQDFSGEKVPKRIPGAGKEGEHVIEDAPGSYVKVRYQD